MDRNAAAKMRGFSAALFAILPLAVYSASVEKRSTCTVASNGNTADSDVPALDDAISSCGSGGVIVLSEGKTYALNAVWDISDCKGCEIQIEGTLKLSDDYSYWEGKTGAIYASGMSDATIISKTGRGVIDGNGQGFWEVYSGDSSYARPTLVYLKDITSVTLQDLYIKNAPNVFHSVVGSTSVNYINNTLSAVSTNSSVQPKNTDGWDIGSSSYITISNSAVTNDDDCVAFKPGASYVTIDTLTCTGSHGVSVGSLGETAGQTDTVENIYVKDITMIDSAKALGIKLYQGGSSHGSAIVSNVTYDGVVVSGCDYAVEIQSCYGSSSTAACEENPSTAKVTGFYVKNVSGTTSDTSVISLDCPADGTCDVYLEDFSVKPSSGTAEYLCSNLSDESSLGVTCTGTASG